MCLSYTFVWKKKEKKRDFIEQFLVFLYLGSLVRFCSMIVLFPGHIHNSVFNSRFIQNSNGYFSQNNNKMSNKLRCMHGKELHACASVSF